ncbi:hypothetical protein [Calorimonas adulescens]|jgi:hypothetical protein|uniref:Uncharacterized protein n=1 Tax=Calorimonas adulescens TaxID=2606906 RepID=A0A5D8QFD9_9THEO|nr:hypothetical protein [Calorimonas adulescens]MDI6601030.1 hypothetical protein [Thermoanaerobacteraceae bacterium]TZE83222.1 hypothetical protein FWJ32_02585 [Calorimonas adulescens]
MFGIAKTQLRVFYLLLLGVWGGASIYTMVKIDFWHGAIVMMFGFSFTLCVYYMQKLFIKMIDLENKALKGNNKR